MLGCRDVMDPSSLHVTVAAAAVLGVTSSLHCAAMCGPLVGCWAPVARTRREAVVGAGLYHLARALGYGVAGAIVGAIGSFATRGASLGPALPLAIAVLLGLQLAGPTRAVRAIPGLGPLVFRLARKAAVLPAKTRALALGAITPIMPCGLLLAMYGVAAVSGGALAGGLSMLGFAAGSLPSLALAQVGWSGMRHLAGGASKGFERVALVLAMAALVWRGVGQMLGPACH